MESKTTNGNRLAADPSIRKSKIEGESLAVVDQSIAQWNNKRRPSAYLVSNGNRSSVRREDLPPDLPRRAPIKNQ